MVVGRERSPVSTCLLGEEPALASKDERVQAFLCPYKSITLFI